MRAFVCFSPRIAASKCWQSKAFGVSTEVSVPMSFERSPKHPCSSLCMRNSKACWFPHHDDFFLIVLRFAFSVFFFVLGNGKIAVIFHRYFLTATFYSLLFFFSPSTNFFPCSFFFLCCFSWWEGRERTEKSRRKKMEAVVASSRMVVVLDNDGCLGDWSTFLASAH